MSISLPSQPSNSQIMIWECHHLASPVSSLRLLASSLFFFPESSLSQEVPMKSTVSVFYFILVKFTKSWWTTCCHLNKSQLNSHNSVLFPLCVSCLVFLSSSQSRLCLWKSHLSSSLLPVGLSDLSYTNYSNISSHSVKICHNTHWQTSCRQMSHQTPFMSRMSAF